MTLFRASAINGGSQSLGIPLWGIANMYQLAYVIMVVALMTDRCPAISNNQTDHSPVSDFGDINHIT